MTYEARIVGRFVEVTSARTGRTYRYEIPPGADPAAFALRCKDRARVPDGMSA